MLHVYELIASIFELPETKAPGGEGANECVLHFVGQLKWPVLVGQSCDDGNRVVFNVRDNLVQFDNEDYWYRVDKIEPDSLRHTRLIQLIWEWENAIWSTIKTISK